MFTYENLEKIGFTKEESDFIIGLVKDYSHRITLLAEKYLDGAQKEMFVPYEEDQRNEAIGNAVAYTESVQKALPEIDGYKSRFLGWLVCLPYLKQKFEKHGLCDDIFYESARDFVYKLRECKAVYGTDGFFVDWFFLFFDLKLFAFGRLQYEIATFESEKYSCGPVELKKGDVVYSCHIPSGGRLSMEMCMESFQRAYDFFRPQLNGSVMPIVCDTWLFYEPYLDCVFPKGSNLEQFIKLFDIIHNTCTGDKFNDCWRVFDKMYEGNADNLPQDNTLRRNFVRYIKDGGDFGYGYGILLYDGEKREIISKK